MFEQTGDKTAAVVLVVVLGFSILGAGSAAPVSAAFGDTQTQTQVAVQDTNTTANFSPIQYSSNNGNAATIENAGLLAAIGDWRQNDIGTSQLLDVINFWRTDEPLLAVEFEEQRSPDGESVTVARASVDGSVAGDAIVGIENGNGTLLAASAPFSGETTDIEIDGLGAAVNAGQATTLTATIYQTAGGTPDGPFLVNNAPIQQTGDVRPPVISDVVLDSVSSLLNESGQPLVDDSVTAIEAEPTATNTDADGDGDAVSYPSDTDIPVVAIDGGVVGITGPFVASDTDFAGYGNEEFMLTLYDKLLGDSGTILHDEGHGQFYTLAPNGGDDFQTFADFAENNGYTYQNTTDIANDTANADAFVITTPSDAFSQSELDALSTFVDNGGVVFLHDQSDFRNFDATDNHNAIASALNASFRFNDDQVVDSQNNAGQSFRPTTGNFNEAGFPPLFSEAQFAVSGLTPSDATLSAGEAFDVSATVTNDGDTSSTGTIELRLEPDGSAVETRRVQLDPGESTTVTFQNVSVAQAGEYNHTVASPIDRATGTLTVEFTDVLLDSVSSLLDENGQPLTDDSITAIEAEPSASNEDTDGDGDAVSYPSDVDIPVMAVDGNVVGVTGPFVTTDTDFAGYSNEEIMLNLYDELLGGSGTILHDEGHGQFYTLSPNGGDDFQAFADYARNNGYTYQNTTDIESDIGTADAVVITSPSEAFTQSELDALSTFADNGGVVFLHDQSDFRNFDATDNHNEIASAVDASFRFNDDQVVDDQNNTGARFVPETGNFNVDRFAGLFTDREGLGFELDVNETYEVDVTDVTDGDTVNVQFSDGTVDTVRIVGIDTPETGSTDERLQEYEGIDDGPALKVKGDEATSYAQSQLSGETVNLTFDPNEGLRGNFGRLLGFLELPDGSVFNEEIVRDGWARVYDSGFDQHDTYWDLEQQARANSSGIWNISDPAATPEVGDDPVDELFFPDPVAVTGSEVPVHSENGEPLVALDADANVAAIGGPLIEERFEADEGGPGIDQYGVYPFLTNVMEAVGNATGGVVVDGGHGQFAADFAVSAEDTAYYLRYLEGQSPGDEEFIRLDGVVDLASDAGPELVDNGSPAARAVIISTPTSELSPAERTAVADFADAGGAVILLGSAADTDALSNFDPLLNDLNASVGFTETAVTDSANNLGGDSSVPTTSNFSDGQYPDLFTPFTEGGTPTFDDVVLDSVSSLLDENEQPLTDDSMAAIEAESTATNTDADGNGDAVSYPSDVDIPVLAVDGNVVGITGPFVTSDTDFGNYSNDEVMLNLYDELLGGSGTILHDEGHGQFYTLAPNGGDDFQAFADRARNNGYTYQSTTDIANDTANADAFVITTPSETFTQSELDALSTFVDNGGVVFLHDQSDFSDFDATDNHNEIASAVNASFRFNDDQVVDSQNNAGQSFRPTTGNFNEATFPTLFDRAPFNVTGLSPADATVTEGEAFDVSATVTNDGTEGDEQTIELRLEPDEPPVLTKTVQLGPGDSTIVTFQDVSVDQAGEYNHTIASLTDRETGSLTVEIPDVFLDSVSSLLNESSQPLVDDSVTAIEAESTATNTDADGDGDAVSYPSDVDIPVLAVDGNVVGVTGPFVTSDTDFGSYSNDEVMLNLYDKLLGGSGTILHDEGHGQFYTLSPNGGNDFQAFAALARDNGYTYQSTTDIANDTANADAFVITTPSDSFSQSELDALSTFVDNGGVVFLHDQSDFRNFDATDNHNAIASAVNASFRFNDDQVVDSQNNAGQSFLPTTGNFNDADFPSLFLESSFAVSGLTPATATVSAGEEFDVSATVTNDGGASDLQSIELRLEPDGSAVATQTVALDPGENTTVTFQNVSVNQAGEYNHTVASATDRASGTLTVEKVFADVFLDSVSSLLNESSQPLVDDSMAAIEAESTATNTDADGNGDAVSYPSDVDIPVLAVDGNVVGITGPFVTSDTDFGNYSNDEVVLNLYDKLLGGSGTILHDEGHGQFYTLSPNGGDDFQAFADRARNNGYTYQNTTDIVNDTANADAFVITTPSDGFTQSELDALSTFVDNGGVVFLHDQSDFNDFDATDNHNEIASAVNASFRFNDDQVVDSQNNAGQSFRPTTGNFNEATFPTLFSKASFNVSGLTPADATVKEGETFDVSATVTNDGDAGDVRTIELRLEPDGSAVATKTVSLDPGENTTVTFQDVSVSQAGEYNHTVASPGDRETGSLTVEIADVVLDSVSSLLNESSQPLTTDSITAIEAESTASNTDADGDGDAVSYPSNVDIPVLAVDGNVVGVTGPFVASDTDFGSYSNEEIMLNLYDELLGGSGTILHDEGHGQFYTLAPNGGNDFQAFADYARNNGYTYENTTDIANDTANADAFVITTPSDGFAQSELDALSAFVDNGGVVFLHDQSDFNNFDATDNHNAIASALNASFRFNDDQVVDSTNNAGQSFRPTTGNYNEAEFPALFGPRSDAGLTAATSSMPVVTLPT